MEVITSAIITAILTKYDEDDIGSDDDNCDDSRH